MRRVQAAAADRAADAPSSIRLAQARPRLLDSPTPPLADREVKAASAGRLPATEGKHSNAAADIALGPRPTSPSTRASMRRALREEIVAIARRGQWAQIESLLAVQVLAGTERTVDVLSAMADASQELEQTAELQIGPVGPDPGPGAPGAQPIPQSAVAQWDAMLNRLGDRATTGLAARAWQEHVVGTEDRGVLSAFYALLHPLLERHVQRPLGPGERCSMTSQFPNIAEAMSRSPEQLDLHRAVLVARGSPRTIAQHLWGGLMLQPIPRRCAALAELLRSPDPLPRDWTVYARDALAALVARLMRAGGNERAQLQRDTSPDKLAVSLLASARWNHPQYFERAVDCPAVGKLAFHLLRMSDPVSLQGQVPGLIRLLPHLSQRHIRACLEGLVEAGIAPLSLVPLALTAVRDLGPCYRMEVLRTLLPKLHRARTGDGKLLLLRPTLGVQPVPDAPGTEAGDQDLRSIFKAVGYAQQLAKDPQSAVLLLKDVVRAVLQYLHQFEDHEGRLSDTPPVQWVPAWPRVERLLREAIPVFYPMEMPQLRHCYKEVMSNSPDKLGDINVAAWDRVTPDAIWQIDWSLDPNKEGNVHFDEHAFLRKASDTTRELSSLQSAPGQVQALPDREALNQLRFLLTLLKQPAELKIPANFYLHLAQLTENVMDYTSRWVTWIVAGVSERPLSAQDQLALDQWIAQARRLFPWVSLPRAHPPEAPALRH